MARIIDGGCNAELLLRRTILRRKLSKYVGFVAPMAAVGGGRITTVVTVPTRTTRGATGTVAIGIDSRGGGINSAPISFFDAIILWARVGDTRLLLTQGGFG